MNTYGRSSNAHTAYLTAIFVLIGGLILAITKANMLDDKVRDLEKRKTNFYVTIYGSPKVTEVAKTLYQLDKLWGARMGKFQARTLSEDDPNTLPDYDHSATYVPPTKELTSEAAHLSDR